MTGFGLLGHAQNLASAQKAAVSFKIHTLPGMHIHVCVLTVYIYTCTFGTHLLTYCNVHVHNYALFTYCMSYKNCNCEGYNNYDTLVVHVVEYDG